MQRTQLQQVTCFKFRGAFNDQKTSCSHEIRARLGSARAALHSLDTLWISGHRTFPKIIKLKVLKTLVWLIATYSCETWTTCSNDFAKSCLLWWQCVKKILSVHWTVYRTNESILRELNMKRTLQRQRKLQYFGPVVGASNIWTTGKRSRDSRAKSRLTTSEPGWDERTKIVLQQQKIGISHNYLKLNRKGYYTACTAQCNCMQHIIHIYTHTLVCACELYQTAKNEILKTSKKDDDLLYMYLDGITPLLMRHVY